MPNLQPYLDSREHAENQKAKRIVGVDPFGGLITDGNLKVVIDSPDASTTYIGMAQIGTSTSATGWQIKKITESGSTTTVAWADGTDRFDHVWSDRTTFSYS